MFCLVGIYPKDTYFLYSTESVSIEKKSSKPLSATEQMRLIQQLDDEVKQTILRLIEKMLTNKKFKDFFAKNVAAL